MSDQHQVEEVSRTRSSEGISDVEDCPEGLSQNNGSKFHQKNEEKPEEVETGKRDDNSDGFGLEILLRLGIRGDTSVKDYRGAEKSRPDPGLKTGNDPNNYEDKYPEDKIYEETAPNARVYRTYVDESKKRDDKMVEESKDSVDVLLVFAGLFSAVVTTFVAQTSQSLQADYAQVSASLLFEVVLIQRAITNGSSLDNVPVSTLNPYTKFTPATTDVWVNGLWFTSLSFSLATALVAVLVKQWLHHYIDLPSGMPQERSLVRQFRYGGFLKWHVLVIVGLLPVLMHLALGVFFVGLTIFLVPLRPGFSWVIGVGTVAAYTTYLITVFLPILYPQCPYRTPLSDLVYFPYRYIMQDLFPKHVRPLFVKEVQRPTDESGAKISSLDGLERRVVQDESDTLSVEALHWLYSSSSNPTVHGIVVQCIGGLSLSAMDAVKKVFGEAKHIRDAHYTLLDGSIQYLGRGCKKPLPGMESKVERLLRFELFIPNLLYYADDDKSRFYIDAADDKGLAVAVQSNDTLQRSDYKSPDLPTSAAYFRRVALAHDVKLPLVIWFGLMRMAKNDDAFAPIDTDSLDDFPLHLCRYVNVRPRAPDITVSCVTFEAAVLYYFPKECSEELTANMLNMISKFDRFADKTSFPPTFTFALAFVRYVLHRVSLVYSFDGVTKDAIIHALANLTSYSELNNLSDDQVVALSDLVEDIVIRSPIFKVEHEWMLPQMALVDVYSAMVGASSSHCPGSRYSPRHNFWPALRPLVEFLIHQYVPRTYFVMNVPPFGTMCEILGFGLSHGVQTVYDVFLETRCLDVFRDHSLHPLLVGVINRYVAGLAAPHALINSQRYLDHLHQPDNLFLACYILTTNGWKDFREMPDSTEMRRAGLCSNIRALASLRPLDPSWDQCRQKLRDLLKGEVGEFFAKQQKWWGLGLGLGFEDLKPEDIGEAKSNISLALGELDDFFSGSMPRRFLGGIYKYLPYPRRRERDEVQV